MFYAKYRDMNGEEVAKLYDLPEEYYADTFSPEVEPLTVIDFSVKGKNYRERQSSVKTVAENFQRFDNGSLRGVDYWRIGAWLEKEGKRFGLLQLFRKHSIWAFEKVSDQELENGWNIFRSCAG